MNHTRIFVVMLVLLLLTVVGVGKLVHRTPAAKPQTTIRIPRQRTLRGTPPLLASDVPGVRLVALGAPEAQSSGAPESLSVSIVNDSNRAVEAFELTPINYKPQLEPGQMTVSTVGFSEDAREALQSDGSLYSFRPTVPLIRPHEAVPITISLNDIPDEAQLAITSVVWRDGTAAGRNGARLHHWRAQKAAEHGHPEELAAEKK